MSLVTMPASPVPAKIDWKADQPTQVNRSEFTGRRRVTILSAAPRLKATVTLPRIIGEDRIFEWRAFVFDCEGQANRFQLIACERDQIAGVTVKVDGAGQGGYTLNTKGWGSAGLKLKRGQFLTVNEQLLILTQDVVADGSGNAVCTFKRYLRISPDDDAAIEVTRPYAVVSLANDDTGWIADIGQEYGVSFEVEESF